MCIEVINRKTISGDDNHKEKEHVGIMSLYRDAGYFYKNKTNQVTMYDRLKQINKFVMIALLTPKKMNFPFSYNPGEDYTVFRVIWVPLMTQMVKNLPAMQETRV